MINVPIKEKTPIFILVAFFMFKSSSLLKNAKKLSIITKNYSPIYSFYSNQEIKLI